MNGELRFDIILNAPSVGGFYAYVGVSLWRNPADSLRFVRTKSATQSSGVNRRGHYGPRRSQSRSIMYFARAQASVSQAEPAWVFAGPVLLIRSRGAMAGLVNSVKDAIRRRESRINIQFEVLRTQIRDSYGWAEIWAMVCGVLGALLIAAIGLYGVISYTIAQRTNEIGIRMALGAQRSGVVRLIMSEAAILVGMGLVVGLGLTFAGGVALEYSFFGVTQRDPLSLALTLVILAAVGFAASELPLRSPMVALGYE